MPARKAKGKTPTKKVRDKYVRIGDEYYVLKSVYPKEHILRAQALQTVAEEIAKRRNRGPQTALAMVAGVTQGAVSQWLNVNNPGPSVECAQAIIEWCDENIHPGFVTFATLRPDLQRLIDPSVYPAWGCENREAILQAQITRKVI